jgi:outer membrane autotransporter protein
VAGSAAFGESFFGFASYTDESKSGNHLKPLSAGVGYHYGLNTSLDLVGGASFESLKVTGLSSESGWGLGVGLRGVVGKAELQGGVKYVDIGDFGNDTTFTLGGRYNFTEMVSAGLDLTKWDDLDLTQFSLTLRYSF